VTSAKNIKEGQTYTLTFSDGKVDIKKTEDGKKQK
jgi:hypothetical protein